MDPITTDLAGKVLTANVRNIIQKVQDGGRLTAGEIKIFEQYTVEQSELHRTRQAALIRRWSGGGRLTEEEKAEIAGIVPVEPKKPPAPTSREYQKDQKHYAAFYKQSDRTIKRWIKTGRDAKPTPDLPPLDDPAQMPAWWPRHYKHKVPVEILDAARSAPRATPAPPAQLPPPPSADHPQIVVGTGFREMLERVKSAEATAYREYDIALKAQDEAKLPGARKTWSELSKQLRELERDAPAILAGTGQLVERSAVEKVIAEIHAPIINGLRSMWRRVKPRILAAAEAQQDKVWQEECDRLLARLNESEFLAHE